VRWPAQGFIERGFCVMRKTVCAFALAICGIARAQTAAPDAQQLLHEKIFDFVVNTVAQQYYDPTMKGLAWREVAAGYKEKLAEKKTQGALYQHLNALLGELNDSHTRVIPKALVQQQAQLAVNIGVRGVRLGEHEGVIFVREVVSESPAAQAGLLVGDVLKTVAGESALERFQRAYNANEKFIASRRLEASLSAVLRVRDDRALVLTVDREGVSDLIAIPADPIAPPAPVSFEMLSVDISHIVLRRFRGDAMPIIFEALRDRAPRGFVFDLRGNDGGDLAVVMSIAERVFVAPTTIAHELTRNGGVTGLFSESAERSWVAGGKPGMREEPIAVLIDERCASACEVFAAALQESGRARVFGHASAGIVAGISIKPIEMPDGGGLNVSRIGILSPGKRALDNVGVTPDETCTVTLADTKKKEDCVMTRAHKWLAGQIAY
jgi:carboxyl-terminal processing protease